MFNNRLPAVALTASLFASGFAAPVFAGHANEENPHAQMPSLMAHHGLMQGQGQASMPARLGVAISAISQGQLDKLSLEYGVLVEEVMQGSVAETAGLHKGDVITNLDGRPAYSPERLQHLVGQVEGGSTVAVSRDGESLKLQVAFAQAEPGKAVLGVRIQEMSNDLKEAFGTEGDAGVLVSQVMRNSAAGKAGLKAGDIIVSVGGDRITTVPDVHAALDSHSPGDSVAVAIVRERETKSLQVALGSAGHAKAKHHPGMRGGHGYGMQGYDGHGKGFHGSHGMTGKHGCGMQQGQRPS